MKHHVVSLQTWSVDLQDYNLWAEIKIKNLTQRPSVCS